MGCVDRSLSPRTAPYPRPRDPFTGWRAAEAAVLHALVAAGKHVWLPFQASGRCDLLFQDDRGLHRVQCKAATVRHGAVTFMTCSATSDVARDYRDDVDYFGAYCHERGEVYLVPVHAVPTRRAFLRLQPTRNGQVSGLRWASDYLLSSYVLSGSSPRAPTPAGAAKGTTGASDHKRSRL